MKQERWSKHIIALTAGLLPILLPPVLFAPAAFSSPTADKSATGSSKTADVKSGNADEIVETLDDTTSGATAKTRNNTGITVGKNAELSDSKSTSVEKVASSSEEEELVRKNEAARLNNLAADHYDLARHYMHKFDFEMAEVELEAAIMYKPGMKAAHRDYCLVSLVRGQGARAGAELIMVVGLGDPIPLNNTEKSELVKKAAKLHYQKGLNYGAKYDWKSATAEFLWALAFAPENASVIHSLAFSYAASGDFAHAQEQYEKAFAADPANAYSHADFAFLLAEHGDRQHALSELQNAVRLNPSVAALHVDVGWMAEAQGNLKLAEDEFHKAVELSPHHAGLWSHLGQVEEHLGNSQGAKLAYGEALNIDPTSNEARNRLKALESGTSSPAEQAPKHDVPDQAKQLKQSS